ncbi:MAG: hypothetical protein U0905_14015 [Pirellulales bacterium]
MQQPSTVMSTAEAVAVTAAILREGAFSHLDLIRCRGCRSLAELVMKDDAKDRERYCITGMICSRRRSESGHPVETAQ